MKFTKCSNVSYDECKKFYKTEEWKDLRDNFLFKQEILLCMNCCYQGSVSSFQVDHIEPIKYRWDLRLDENNLQILCCYCNKEKANNRLGWI